MYTLRCTFYEPAHMETVLKSFRALSCILLSKAPRRFTCLWARFWSSKAAFLNWESRPISVDPVRLLASMAAARCVWGANLSHIWQPRVLGKIQNHNTRNKNSDPEPKLKEHTGCGILFGEDSIYLWWYFMAILGFGTGQLLDLAP